jgi:DNA polymerase V
MGPDGAPSPTVNTVFEKIQKEHELGSKFDLKEISIKTHLEIPSALERFSAGPAFGTKDHIDKSIDLNDFLIFNPISTFMGRVDSESMLYAGFEIDDPFWSIRALQHNIEISF